MKFASRYADIFLADDFVVLTKRYFACLAVEIPAGTLLKRDGDDRLWRSKLNQLAVQINPCPTDDSMFIHGEKVRVGNHAGAMHFELEKILPVDVLRSIDAIQHWLPDLAIGVQFGVRNTPTL